MPSREKAVEKLQLQSRILEGDQCIDLRLTDQFFHAMLIGIRLDTYVGIGCGDSQKFLGGIHSCDDASVRQLAEDLTNQEKSGLLVLLDR